MREYIMISVLIIEDDPMVAFIHQQYLEKLKQFHPILITNTIEEGLKLSQKAAPELVLLDLQLKDQSGLDYIKEIRKISLNIEVIVISADNNVDSITQVYHLGAIDYLVKPFSFDRFQKSISIFQEKRKQLLKNHDSFSQKEIDLLFKHNTDVKIQGKIHLEKGLTQATLCFLIKHIKKLPKQFTVQDLSQISNISHVSVRKYIVFLEEKNLLRSKYVYLKVGRPYRIYEITDNSDLDNFCENIF